MEIRVLLAERNRLPRTVIFPWKKILRHGVQFGKDRQLFQGCGMDNIVAVVKGVVLNDRTGHRSRPVPLIAKSLQPTGSGRLMQFSRSRLIRSQ